MSCRGVMHRYSRAVSVIPSDEENEKPTKESSSPDYTTTFSYLKFAHNSLSCLRSRISAKLLRKVWQSLLLRGKHRVQLRLHVPFKRFRKCARYIFLHKKRICRERVPFVLNVLSRTRCLAGEPRVCRPVIHVTRLKGNC